MLTTAGAFQHMAQPTTTDGESWTWISLCGIKCNPTRTASALRRNGEHTGRLDCGHCAKAVREGRATTVTPTAARILSAAIRR